MSIENTVTKKERQPKIEIVPAMPEDVRGMQEVSYRTWLATYPNEEAGITKDDVEDRYKDAFTEEKLAKRAEDVANPEEGDMRFLAKDNGKVVGICRVIEREDINQLQAIYVLPEYQGKGIGTLLWKEAQRHFNPSKNIVVHVATYNQNAIDFYKRLGFEDTGKRWSDEHFRMKSGAMIPAQEMVIRVKSN